MAIEQPDPRQHFLEQLRRVAENLELLKREKPLAELLDPDQLGVFNHALSTLTGLVGSLEKNR
ncbi:MAG: hypothetical protein GC164_11895 [Phycisphaera sp.]|nr:hypothetical protein [Phycisphaera sp.]